MLIVSPQVRAPQLAPATPSAPPSAPAPAPVPAVVPTRADTPDVTEAALLHAPGTPGRKWQDAAAARAGIDLESWDIRKGFAANEDTVWRSYDYYRTIQQAHPHLQWTGMAYGIAPMFGAGLKDLSVFNGAIADMQRKADSAPAPIAAALRGVLELGGRNGVVSVARDLERRVQDMQKAIFLDQSMQHEAYIGGGMGAIVQLRDSGAIDQRMLDAWAKIDSGRRLGDTAMLREGNLELLWREQNETIARQYEGMRDFSVLSPLVTKALSTIGRPGFPGARTAGEIDPIEIGPIDIPIPGIDISRRDDRWKMIEEDTWPAYLRLVDEQPETFRKMLETPIRERVAASGQRMLPDKLTPLELLKFYACKD